jgi:hypothetical protein
MVIAEWNGWVWECFHCDYVGRIATNEETEKQEDEIEAYLKQQRINKE